MKGHVPLVKTLLLLLLLLIVNLERVICSPNDDAISKLSAVECYLAESDATYLYFDSVSQGWRRPHPALAASFISTNTDSSSLEVKDCWCARLLGRNGDFCLPEFDTCFVPGKQGAVICSTTSTQVNIARGVWPFCIFMFVTMIYLWVASETGRRARAYLRRQWGNGMVHLKKKREERQQQQTEEEEEEEEVSDDEHPDGDEETGTNTGSDHSPPANAENQSAHDEPTHEVAIAQQEQQDDNETDSDDSNDSEATVTYPEELGSRSNFLQLLHELHYMHQYEPERLARLFQSAWLRERRVTQRAARRERLRNLTVTFGAFLNHQDSQAEENEESSPREPNRQESPLPIQPWWDTRRTIKLQLKTKRFNSSELISAPSAVNVEVEADREDRSAIELDGDGNATLLPAGGKVQASASCAESGSENGDFDGRRKDGNTDLLPETVENHADITTGEDEEVIDDNTCAICLSELEDGELVGDIPCGHYFHKDCLKSWLTRSNRCPLCQHQGIASCEIMSGQTPLSNRSDDSSSSSSSNEGDREQQAEAPV